MPLVQCVAIASVLTLSVAVLACSVCSQVTCDQIFVLCGIYGDVQRVKILYNKKSSALVEFMSPEQTATCAQFLKDCPFYGKTLHLVISSASSLPLSATGTGSVFIITACRLLICS